MAQAAVAAYLGKTLYIERHTAAEVALHDVVVVYALTYLGLFLIGEILYAGVGVNTGLLENFLRASPADTVDVGEADLYPCLLYTSPSPRDA